MLITCGPGNAHHGGGTVSKFLKAFSGLRWFSICRPVWSTEVAYQLDTEAILQHADTLQNLQLVYNTYGEEESPNAFNRQQLARVCDACQSLEYFSFSFEEVYPLIRERRPEARDYNQEDLMPLVSMIAVVGQRCGKKLNVVRVRWVVKPRAYAQSSCPLPVSLRNNAASTMERL